jgi:nucleotidyltransferase substrate binding protein (TIGR01987 family)
MERIDERLRLAERAIATLEEILPLGASTIARDAAIQRFEYSFEATWKAARQFLIEREGVDVASPKGVIRSSRDVALLSDEETLGAIAMTDDRNLTSHTYNEGLAEALATRLPAHAALLRAWSARMRARVTPDGT